MIKRALSVKLKQLAKKFPVVCVVGPRQSGKTVLVRSVFPARVYANLEEMDTREFALNDPRGFLDTYGNGAIIDEVQRAPSLFSYIQAAVDRANKAGQFILTGSQNILLAQNVSQTLAGRVAVLKLLPFGLDELKRTRYQPASCEEYIFKGSYPRIYDKNISPLDWYPNYIQTYVERDVRMLKEITDLSAFQKFIKLCAGRIGQVLNLSSLGNDCGITHNTAKAWLSVLESTYIIFLLKPYYRNFNKRLIKMPKLYFYDTGLACSLLGIEGRRQLSTHYAAGNLFESLVLSEMLKHRFHCGLEPNYYYWRDKTGHEVDCIMDIPAALRSIEIKYAKTIADDFFSGLQYWKKVAGKAAGSAYLIYNGQERQKRVAAEIVGWKDIAGVVA